MLITFCHIRAKVNFGLMVGQQKLPMVNPRVHGRVHALLLRPQDANAPGGRFRQV